MIHRLVDLSPDILPPVSLCDEASLATPAPRPDATGPGSVPEAGSLPNIDGEAANSKKRYSKRYLWMFERLNNRPARKW